MSLVNDSPCMYSTCIGGNMNGILLENIFFSHICVVSLSSAGIEQLLQLCNRLL